MKRRKFIKTAGIVTIGASLPPFLTFCGEDKKIEEKAKINFSGSIKGENYKIGHLLRDKKIDFSEAKSEEHIYDVVIVGGGVSALISAWKLLKKGVSNFLIIEKEPKLGGLCIGGQTESGTKYSSGAHYVWYPEPDSAILELYQDLEIVDGFDKYGWPKVKKEYQLKEPLHNLYVENQWINEEFPFSIAKQKDIEEFERFFAEVDRLSKWRDDENKKALGIPLSKISKKTEIRELDSITMKEYLKKNNYKSELLNWYVNIWLVDEYGTPIESCSAWAGLNFFRKIIFPQNLNCSDEISWENGLGFISEKLTQFLNKKHYKLNTYAINIENITENKVRTITYDIKKEEYKKIIAKKVIVAVPKHQIYDLIPTLKEAKRNEFKDLNYSSWLIANIHLKEALDFGDNAQIAWENTFYNSWSLGYVNNAHSNDKNNAKHVLTLYAAFYKELTKERQQLQVRGWEFWANKITEELEIAFPEVRKKIEKIDIWKWGHPMRQVNVNSVFGEKRKKMKKKFGNILFTHVDVCGLPIFEEAAYRAMEVLNEIE